MIYGIVSISCGMVFGLIGFNWGLEYFNLDAAILGTTLGLVITGIVRHLIQAFSETGSR